MSYSLSKKTLQRLDIQGFDKVEEQQLAQIAPWLRIAFGGCAILAGVGTVLASPFILLVLVPIAVLAALFPVHPFDLIYNLGIRHIRGTGPLPKRGAPSRFACGMGAVWLLTTAWTIGAGYMTAGYVLGAALTGVAVLVSTTNICIPSMIYRAIFGAPQREDVIQCER